MQRRPSLYTSSLRGYNSHTKSQEGAVLLRGIIFETSEVGGGQDNEGGKPKLRWGNVAERIAAAAPSPLQALRL